MRTGRTSRPGTSGASGTILAANLLLQLDKPTGGKTIFEEQKQLNENHFNPEVLTTGQRLRCSKLENQNHISLTTLNEIQKNEQYINIIRFVWYATVFA